MTDTVWDPQGEAHRALAAAVSEQGLAALSSPSRLDNLLKDLLPDLPREASLLVAAAEVNLAAMLEDRIAAGVDVGTAIRLSAATLEQGRPFDPSACRWVAREFALALGMGGGIDAAPDPTPAPAMPPPGSASARPLPVAGPPLAWPSPQAPPPPVPSTPPSPDARTTAPAIPVLGDTEPPRTLPLQPEPTAIQPVRPPAAVPDHPWALPEAGSRTAPAQRLSASPGPPTPPLSPGGADRGQPPRSRRGLVAATFVVVVLIIVIGGGAALLALRHHGSPSAATTTPATTTATTNPPTGLSTSTTQSVTTTSTTTSTTVPPPPTGLVTINNYLAQSATARGDVSEAELGVQNCTEQPGPALTQLNAGLALREGIADNLPSVDLSDVPGGSELLTSLSTSIDDSITADKAFVAWVNDVQATSGQGQGGQGQGSCGNQNPTDPNWQRANTASVAANAAKSAFVAEWNPLATTYNLKTYTADGF